MLGDAGRWIVKTVVGVILCIVIWEAKAWLGFGPPPALKAMPAQLWDGGTTIVLKTDLSAPGHIHFMFSPPGDDGHMVEGREDLVAGTREFSITVPAGASGTIDLGIENPPLGAHAKIEYWLGGKLMMTDENTLAEPLKEGWAFGVQISAEDLSRGVLEDGVQGGEGDSGG